MWVKDNSIRFVSEHKLNMKLISNKTFLSILLFSTIIISLNSGCRIFRGHDYYPEDVSEIPYDSYNNDDDEDTEAPPVGEYHPSHTIINDILSTKLEVSFDWEHQYMPGKATITFKPHFYPTDSLTLDAKGFDIYKVELVSSSGNKPLTYVYDSLQLHIFLDKSYTRNDSYSIYIEYKAKPNERKTEGSAAITDAKGLYFINPKGEEPNKPKQIWTQGETESNSAWFPTIDKPNMKTLIEIYMTVDTQYVTLSNGLMLDSKNNKNGTRTDHWKMDLPIAPYLVMMAVGDFKITHDKWRNISVDYYVEPEYSQYAKEIFGRTPEMIECYSKLLGVDYPWSKYSQIVVRDFVSGAMENTTAVVHYDELNQTHREMIDGNHDDIICHELFHHWFGDLVTCESWSNISLNESFADYSEALWTEYKNGKDAHDLQVNNDKNTYLMAATENPVPLIRYHYQSQEDLFDANSYQRGGCVLNMLRNYVGDEAFFKSLNVYLTENKFGTGEVHTLRMAFEKVTGEDLNWFFNEYYLSPGHPSVIINYTYSDESNAEFVTIEQTQDTTTGTPVFRLPIDVDVYSGGETKRYRVVMNKARQTFSFPAYTKPDLINVDATKSILWEKTDNKSDSEYVFQFKHAPLFMDRYEAVEHFENYQDLDEQSRLALIDAMNDKFWNIRKSAIEMIALDDEKTISAVKSILVSIVKSDPNPQVRTAALKKLGGLTDEEMIISITDISAKDSSFSVLGATITVLKDHNPEKAYTLAKSLKNENSGDLIYSLAAILADKGSSDDYGWFEKNLNESGFYEMFSVLTAMKTYLVNSNSEVRLKGVDLLTTIALNDSKGLWVKLSASGVLSQIKTELEFKRAENRTLDNDIEYIKKKLDEIDEKQSTDLNIQIEK